MIQLETRKFTIASKEFIAAAKREIKENPEIFNSANYMSQFNFPSVHEVIAQKVNPYHSFYVTETAAVNGYSEATITAVFLPDEYKMAV